MAVRRLLHRLGYRYTLHRKDLPGRPDIVFSGRRKIVEVRGCFWHAHPDPACPKAGIPATRKEWWRDKLASNVSRDERNRAALEAAGWDVLVLWECELRTDVRLKERLVLHLGQARRWQAANAAADPLAPDS